MTRLSIIIPLYNTEKYIGETLDSIVNQEVDDIEVIVVDDASTDKGADIVFNYSKIYNWICLIENKRNKGVSGARNTGILHASGDYITFLDSDDILLPGTLRRRIEFLNKHHQINNFCWDYCVFEKNLSTDKKGEILSNPKTSLALQPYKIRQSEYIIEDPIYFYLKYTCLMWTGTVIVKKEHIEKVGIFNEDLTHCEDTDFWFHLSLNQKLFFGADITTGYRSRPGSASKNREKIMLGIIELRDRLLANKNFKRYKKQIIERRLNDVCLAGFTLRENGNRKALARITIKQIFAGKINIRIIKNLLASFFGMR